MISEMTTAPFTRIASLMFLIFMTGSTTLAADSPAAFEKQAGGNAFTTNTNFLVNSNSPTKPKFTKEQVRKRLEELKELLDRKLILKEFYDRKVKECEVAP